MTELKWNGPWEPYELYNQCVLRANSTEYPIIDFPDRLLSQQDQKVWGAARFAARHTAIALLNKASELKLSPEILEELRKIAETVATD